MISDEVNNDREEMISDLVPDLTPLLDVMFMLIVFLVLTSNTMQQVFDVALPEDTEDVLEFLEEHKTIKVTIFALNADTNDAWAVDDQKFNNYDAFKQSLLDAHNMSPDKKIIIYGDKSVALERLM
ncbi:MAG: biopolymer transporter ExbD, partial [Rickettsiales bacterium]|nr:biopolymer transporter ExbD [Rickettsiales bacterium]